LGLIAAVAVFADSEVEGEEMRMGVLVRNAVVGGSQISYNLAAKSFGMKMGVSAMRNSMVPG
jgi:hypothetical protein